MKQTRRIALLPGDGIGREVVPAAELALRALCGESLAFVHCEIGWETFERTGTALPAETLAALRACDGALLGAVASPSRKVPGYASPVVALRRELDLYANLRPLRGPASRGSHPAGANIDVLLVRENTEGLYAGRERWEGPDTAIAERVITRRASARIARVAFEQARARARRRAAAQAPPHPRVTVVHKANVLRESDGLFRQAALDVAREYPDVEVEEQLVDSMAYRLVREPERFDVVVTTNLYGDILSDLGAALVGGLGVVPSANQGERFCLAEPVHGSAPDIAGRGVANPLATLAAAALLLSHLGLCPEAARLEAAVSACLASGPRTPDLGGTAQTQELTAFVLDLLAAGRPVPAVSS